MEGSRPPGASALPFDARTLIDALPFAAVATDAADEVVAANRAGEALFEASGLVGRKLKELTGFERIPGLRTALDEVKRGAESVKLPACSLRGRATPPTLHDVRVIAVRDARRRPVGILLTAVEVDSDLAALRIAHETLAGQVSSERHELATVNEELRVANDLLHEQLHRLEAAEVADLRKNEFLAMLAHELRNPLGAVLNALHVITRSVPHDRQVQRALRIAERQVQHEARLLDDLLDVSRIIVGKVTLHTDWVDLRQCVRNVVDGAAFAVQAQALDLRVQLPEEPLGVRGDATRLEQCVANLVNNAVKFTPAGGHLLLRGFRDGDHVVLTVRDSGIGIAPDMLSRVFDLFSQADATLARSRGGLGIGLTLVKTLVDLHRGGVSARSPGVGRGSEFEIRLPAAGAGAAAVEPRPAAQPRVLRILVVEDNADAREMLRAVLQLDGHIVSDAADGATAIRRAVETAPDVVLLDIGLPGLDGFDVARRIRQRLGKVVRLVAVSGYGDAAARAQAQAAGFDAHLVKPVSPDDLARTLASL